MTDLSTKPILWDSKHKAPGSWLTSASPLFQHPYKLAFYFLGPIGTLESDNWVTRLHPYLEHYCKSELVMKVSLVSFCPLLYTFFPCDALLMM